MSVTSTKFGLRGAYTAEIEDRGLQSSILDPQSSILLIFFLIFVIFLLIKLALLRLFVQITYAFFTQEHLRAAVGRAEAECVFVVVAHETAHSFAGVEHDDDRDLGGHQLFHVPGFHAGALDGLRRSILHYFLFAFGRALLALLRAAGRSAELPAAASSRLAAEFTASARLSLLSPE